MLTVKAELALLLHQSDRIGSRFSKEPRTDNLAKTEPCRPIVGSIQIIEELVQISTKLELLTLHGILLYSVKVSLSSSHRLIWADDRRSAFSCSFFFFLLRGSLPCSLCASYAQMGLMIHYKDIWAARGHYSCKVTKSQVMGSACFTLQATSHPIIRRTCYGVSTFFYRKVFLLL